LGHFVLNVSYRAFNHFLTELQAHWNATPI
jgi:hypothetical protein